MDRLDIFYKAFEDFKKNTILDTETSRFKKSSSASSGKDYEDIVVYFSTCTIDEDWVNAIEEGLVFVEKAIKEERQFIRNDGEVLPIEKIRKTSKDSIQDLARHSNYITHAPKDDGDSEIMPDKMLMIQKESDFAIYENRVIYSLLVYLRDFVSSRLSAIKETTNKYEANAHINKNIDLGNRKLTYSYSLHELRYNDPVRMERNQSKSIIDRLDLVLTSILVLLKTPLMIQVGKADLVSRPITKTNVLKMNRNFNQSLALFDYIAEYQGDGYTIKTIEKHFAPVQIDIVNEYSEIIMLTSFLTYMYGNSLENDLKKKYFELEKQRQIEEQNKVLARLKEIKVKADLQGQTLNDYLIAFEEGYRIIERRLEEHDREIRELNLQHKKEIEDIHASYAGKVEAAEEKARIEISQAHFEAGQKVKEAEANANLLIEQKEQETLSRIEEIKNETEARIESINNDATERINNAYSECETRIQNIQTSADERIQNMKDNLSAKEQEIDTKMAEMTEADAKIKAENDELFLQKRALAAEVIALKELLGRKVDTTEFVTEQEFNELEKEKDAFLKFFDRAWKDTKKAIRKDLLTIKKKSKKGEDE